MKKNVIQIVVDAYCFDNLNRIINGKRVTPFLCDLASQSCSYDNMFSQAPYTEASQVNILGGEDVLENGGYLFGNGNTASTIFGDYQKSGYETIYTYSPYVYSKSYLRDVDTYFYTRLYSIEPLFFYRLDYYFKKWKQKELEEVEERVCLLLLEEGLETWNKQCEALISKDLSAYLIKDWIRDWGELEKISLFLSEQLNKYKENPKKYLYDIFVNWNDHVLRIVNKKYIKRTKLPQDRRLMKKYQRQMDDYQQKYSKIVRKQSIDLKYIFAMAMSEKKGCDTLKAYYRHYRNQSLSSYLKNINESAKTDVSMNKIFDIFYEEIKRRDEQNKNYFAFIHVQDFHLPSVFHSLDSEDEKIVDYEWSQAFELLDAMDYSYRGNIIADLSARYCDLQIEILFKKLQKTMNNEFVFVVTADHGFPSYEYPPRPYVYNQTYVEAFHIPFIIYDGITKKREEGLYSNVDAVDILKQAAGIPINKKPEERQYILHEYGGPGCPDIGVKPIWYTYMDKQYSISMECSLLNELDACCIKSIYDLKKDPMQKINVVNRLKNTNEIQKRVRSVQIRHTELQNKYAGSKFIRKQLDFLMK